jgi:hypothetical protein
MREFYRIKIPSLAIMDHDGQNIPNVLWQGQSRDDVHRRHS